MTEPTLTSKNLPPVQRPAGPPTPAGLPPKPQASVEVQIPYDQIEAKPLRAPNFVNLWPRNPNVSLFFGNRAVGEKESGMRFDQLIAMGFVPAKPDDVFIRDPNTGTKLPCPLSICRDGRVMYGDLILLKIGRAEYVGALKWNEQSARQRVRKPGVVMNTGASKDIGGSNVLKDDSGRQSPASAGFPAKVNVYVPGLAEVDALTADNSGPTGDPDARPLK